eukprot:m.145896 g.145896  ORF g.145896 m.145896 type:complete len:1212 (+) comp16226_c0_seq2:210-3845(+)
MGRQQTQVRVDSPDGAGSQAEEDAVVMVQGYRPHTLLLILYYFCAIITAGGSLLLSRWLPVWSLKARCVPCSIHTAQYLLLTRASGQRGVEHAPSKTSSSVLRTRPSNYLPLNNNSQSDEPLVFTHRHVRYVWQPAQSCFDRVCGYDVGQTVKQLLSIANRHVPRDAQELQSIHGSNDIAVEVKSYVTLLFEEVLSPFYIFQFLAIVLWCFEEYYYYAGCIALVSFVSIVVSLIDTRRNAVTLRNMIDDSSMVRRIQAIDQQHHATVSSSELVPGDLIELEEGVQVPCDALLIEGGAVINESMLTGESVPITKTPIVVEDGTTEYSITTHKAHTVFRGTEVVQLRSQRAVAMCVRVAFDTSKGQLIRSILYPKPTKFRFYEDGLKFLTMLALFGLAGLVYTVVVLLGRKANPIVIIKRALDLLTVIVPPALPAAMTIGTIYAINRLKKAKIFCISPPRVNVAGKLKLFCFDKTGTLTEDGLTLWGVLGTRQPETAMLDQAAAFLPLRRIDPMQSASVLPDASSDPSAVTLRNALACCHSLALKRQRSSVDVIETGFEANQRFIGDPLEIELVKTAGWRLHEPNSDPQTLATVHQTAISSLPNELAGFSLMLRPRQDMEIDGDVGAGLAIIKEYAFSSQQQRMTVLVAPIGQTASSTDGSTPVALTFVKGAPERVVALCSPASLPADFEQVLDGLTNDGLRVLAIAGSEVEAESWKVARQLPREQVESNLTFLGLVVFENRVKPESAPVLQQLHQAHIRTLMITGDNIKTACSVAHTSGMVPKAAEFLFASTQANKSGVQRLGLRPGHGNIALTPTTYPYGLRHVKFPSLARDDPPSLWLPKHRQDVALAITGAEFAKLRAADFEAYQRFIVSATVFARMSPDQKSQLIEDLIDLDYCVGMCGDGANDCGALKAAHVGISLSEAEASVAAPFTSSVPNISCVVTLIREGRAALVTSFSCFKFMALYSFIEFTTALILYWINSNLGDFQYLYIDLVLILSLALFMADSDASPTLHHQRPPGSLVSPTILVSIVGQIALHVCAQVTILEIVKVQSWFVPLVPDPEVNNIRCFENTAVFLFSTYQYVAVAIAFTLGKPYRAPVLTNRRFVICVLVLLALNTVFVLTPTPFIRTTLELMQIPDDKFSVTLVVLAVGVGLASFIIERGSANSSMVRSSIKALFRKRHYKNKYKGLARDVLTTEWMMGLYFDQEAESS